jgi:hypothetical protein
MPPLTQTLGILLPPPDSGTKYETRLSQEMEMIRTLEGCIPDCASLQIRCHYSFTNWLPFYWAGYDQTTRYTYVLDDLSDPDGLLRGMSSKTRNAITKAQRDGVRAEESDDVGILTDLYGKTFARQGLRAPCSGKQIEAVFRASDQRDACRLFLAKDSQGRVHSALLVVYDNKTMYYLLQGSDPDLRRSGAGLLAQWRSIEFAADVTREYDFEGSMIPSIEHLFRSFGALQKPYFLITRRRWYVKPLAAVRDAANALTPRRRTSPHAKG